MTVRDGHRPRLARAFARTGIQLGLAVAGAWLEGLGTLVDDATVHAVGSAIANIGLVVPPLVLLASTWLGSAKRAPWDRAAGTMVRYRRG